MAKICETCGKKPAVGHNVSHSNRRTKRRFLPNLFRKKMLGADMKTIVEVKLCTRCLRTITNKYAQNTGFTALTVKNLQRKNKVGIC